MSKAFKIASLRPGVKPFRLHWFPRLRSTNDHAAVLRRRGELYAPAIVLTGHQIAGRGRGANTWWSGRGGLTATFALAADDAVSPHQVPLIAGLAVRNAAAELAGGAAVQLKWPNDLLFEGRKLAGLLCERIGRVDLIGLGMNVNVARSEPPADIRARVTSLSQIVGRPIDMSEALATIARHIHALLSRHSERSFSQTLAEYDRHHALVDRRISVTAAAGEERISGICRGMDSMGRLLVRGTKGNSRIIAGHVELL